MRALPRVEPGVEGDRDNELATEYFKPMWGWADAFQNDFAARADWSVKSYEESNHSPVVELGHAADLKRGRGTGASTERLSQRSPLAFTK